MDRGLSPGERLNGYLLRVRDRQLFSLEEWRDFREIEASRRGFSARVGFVFGSAFALFAVWMFS